MVLKAIFIGSYTELVGNVFGVAVGDLPVRHLPSAGMEATRDRVECKVRPFNATFSVALILFVHV